MLERRGYRSDSYESEREPDAALRTDVNESTLLAD